MSIERHEISGHLSKVVEYNGTVHVAGTTAEDQSAGMKQRAKLVTSNSIAAKNIENRMSNNKTARIASAGEP